MRNTFAHLGHNDGGANGGGGADADGGDCDEGGGDYVVYCIAKKSYQPHTLLSISRNRAS